MKLNLSCAHISVAKMAKNREMSTEQYLNFCGELGIEGSDLLNYPALYADKSLELKHVRKWANAAGLKLPCYGVGNNFAVSDETKFKAAVDDVINGLREAADLEIPCLRIFGGYHGDPSCGGENGIGYANGFEKILKGLEQVLPYAERLGVTIALENHGRLPAHAWELKQIVNYFNSERLRILLDLGNLFANNMNEFSVEPLSALNELFKFIVHIHVKDFRPAVVLPNRKIEACLTGTGIVPIRQCMARLAELGYKGFLALEYEAAFLKPEKEGITECFSYLKDVRDAIDLLTSKSQFAKG